MKFFSQGMAELRGWLRHLETRLPVHPLRNAALQQASALQAAIFNSVMFSKIATDANGVIQIFNVGAERMLGYTSAEVVDRVTPADISDPEEVVARAAALSAELSTPIAPGFEALVFKSRLGIEDIYELTYIRKDGSRIPAVVSVTALRDSQDVIIGYLLIGSDNTVRQQAKRALRESEERLHFALEMSHTGGWELDLQTLAAQRTIEHDRIFGYAALQKRWTYELFLQHVLPDDRATVNTGFRAAVDHQTEWQFECRIQRVDGAVRWIQGTGTHRWNAEGPPRYLSGIVQDITTRKADEEALHQVNVKLERARTVAEKANLAKSEFLSSMSHELRSPLNAILGFAQLMDSGSPALTPSQKENIDQVLQAGWYLLELINEILDLSMIESGKISLSPEAVSIAEVLEDCHAMIEIQAAKSGIALTFSSSDCPPFVKADRTRVKQVVVNLLTNAIKYNRVGGRVDVACALRAPGVVRISFRDTGQGLSPANIAQLFQPFNRLGQESGSEQGTGIGLVVSKRLIELMGGAIGVDSVVGAGSTFWIELNTTATPELLIDDTAAAALAVIPALNDAAAWTVLCIEDNPANLLLIEKLIARRAGLQLLMARDGEHGVTLALSAQPDIILMDINLPGISGFQALHILSNSAGTARIPVIALSANAMANDVEKGLQAGFFRYLTKPIKVNEFMTALDDAMAARLPHTSTADLKETN